jgi:anthraniloyl-CoA monooxygenase
MKIVILGGGPAGLYSGLLIKKAHPADDITIIERNPANVTYGWGVVFPDRTLASFQTADYKTYEQIVNHFVTWDSIDVRYRGETISFGGHVIVSISRMTLLNILQRRCQELGITIKYGCEINDLSAIAGYDLLIAADGVNSIVRKTYAPIFKPSIEPGKAKYIWLGTNKVLDAFTFIFCENQHGLFQVHAYPFNATTSTFIVECDEASWLNAGLEKADEAESLAYCQQLLADHLEGARLLSSNSKWVNFPTLKTQNWHHGKIVLLGDAAHTAHFSIGSGTKLAMEDAIALVMALGQHQDLESELNEYELQRKPVIEDFQRAAQESQAYFETTRRYLGLDAVQFSFHLLTYNGKNTYDDLRFWDMRFVEAVDRWCTQKANAHLQRANQADSFSSGLSKRPVFAPPPMFTPLKLRSLSIHNRLVMSPRIDERNHDSPAQDGVPGDNYTGHIRDLALQGAGLIITGMISVSAGGRITPGCAGMYNAPQLVVWKRIVEFVHSNSPAKVAIQLGHAGRRGSTKLRSEGLDRPLRVGHWPLLSASPLPYTPATQVPKEMDRADMDRVRDDFVGAAQMSQEANFDMLQLNFAHGYLLASFLSPLTNQRCDEYGGDLEHRMRFPLEVLDAVRAVWPQEKPISVAISATDCVKGGFTIEDAVVVSRILKEHGCDIIAVHAGQTTFAGDPPFGRGFLTPLSDRIRNEAGIPTMVGGYLTTSNEVNTILAAGRADLCIVDPPALNHRLWA